MPELACKIEKKFCAMQMSRIDRILLEPSIDREMLLAFFDWSS
jgi:hypothetical protein